MYSKLLNLIFAFESQTVPLDCTHTCVNMWATLFKTAVGKKWLKWGRMYKTKDVQAISGGHAACRSCLQHKKSSMKLGAVSWTECKCRCEGLHGVQFVI